MDRRTFTTLVPFFLSPLLCRRNVFAQTPFKLTLIRTFESATCTTGEMFANGKFLCHTLELPWKDNRSYVSSIPSKDYNANVRYDKADHWRIELRNEETAPRSGVQIHIGNYPSEIQGCILPGMEVFNPKAEIRSSAQAYSRLKTSFYGTGDPVSSPNKTISLSIKYNEAPTEFVVGSLDATTRYRQDGVAWLLFSPSANGRHVWNEVRRTDKHIIFKGIIGSGVWENRYIRLALHEAAEMEISETGDDWDTFAEGVKVFRRDATSRLSN